MAYLRIKHPNLGKFWRVLQSRLLVFIFYGRLFYFTVISDILWSFGTIDGYLVHFSVLVCCKKKNLATLTLTDRQANKKVKASITLESSVEDARRQSFRLRSLSLRVARWFVFKPKIQIWVNFGGSCNGR
jgi:hypothetical protein